MLDTFCVFTDKFIVFTVHCASELSLAFGIQKVNMENYLSEFAGMAKNNVNVIMSYNDVIFFYVW